MQDVFSTFEINVVPLVNFVGQGKIRSLLWKLKEKSLIETSKQPYFQIPSQKMECLRISVKLRGHPLTAEMTSLACSWSTLAVLPRLVLMIERPMGLEDPDTSFFQCWWVPAMIFSANSLFWGSPLKANVIPGLGLFGILYFLNHSKTVCKGKV